MNLGQSLLTINSLRINSFIMLNLWYKTPLFDCSEMAHVLRTVYKYNLDTIMKKQKKNRKSYQ